MPGLCDLTTILRDCFVQADVMPAGATAGLAEWAALANVTPM